jgi:penicillin-binding protein 1B
VAKPKNKKAKKLPARRASRSGAYAFLGLAVIAAALATLVTFLYIDQRVADLIEARETGKIPAIYSDVRPILAEHLPPLDLIERELQRRRYRAVDSVPTHAGDYQLDQNRLTFISREFFGSDGRKRPSLRIEIQSSPPSILVQNREASQIELEPQVISNLGSGDQRASKFRPLKEIPKIIRQAVTAIEDERFYEHSGIDFFGIMRALFVNLRAMRVVQGGSTITQQLAKNMLLSPERTIGRKVMEIFAAFSIERRLSKDRILELYLNEVYLGQEGSIAIHGVAEAASSFFGKKLEEVSTPEASVIAGVIKAPSYFAPRRHPKRALERRNVVIEKLYELGHISRQEQTRALEAPLAVVEETSYRKEAPFFIAALKQRLDAQLNVDAALLTGLRVYTGIDSIAQYCAEDALEAGLEKLKTTYPKILKKKQPLEAGLVAIEPFSGKVRAWVGGRDFQKNQFNHVDQAIRQIGSTIKPFLYLTALDPQLNTYKTATPLSVLSDRPVQLQVENQPLWEPENYDHEYRGDVTLRYALENSLNIPAVQVAQKVGFETVARTIRRFRISENVLAVPSLALGALDTNLLAVTSAYGALANSGVYVAPRLFITAMGSEGAILSTEEVKEERVAADAPVYVLNNILQGVVERGTGAAVRREGFRGTAAGKTGTSNDTRDAWFVGFTPILSTGVWVGYDNNDKVGLTGGQAAAPIWAAFMNCISPFYPDTPFIAPNTVVVADIDRVSGQRATENCPREQIVREIFVHGTEPQSLCRFHTGARHEEVPGQVPHIPSEGKRRRSVWDMLFG